MKKRLLSLLLLCGMVLTMVFTAAMAAPAHTHAYGDWTTDELSHRHVCTDPNCPDPAGSEQDLGAHSFTDGDGLICGVCGYTRTIPTPDVPRHNNHPLKWITLISGGRRFHSWSCMTCVDNLVNVPCYRDWTVLREADCTHDGLQARACQICGVESQVISAHHTLTWQSGGGQYWQACQKCDYTSAKQALPVLTITGADRVCATQDYTFTFTLPAGATNAEAGYEFPMVGSDIPVTVDNGVCTGTLEAEWYDKTESSFDIMVSATTAEGILISAKKTVTLLGAHTGGTATCTHPAVCEVCGVAYDDLDPSNHEGTTAWTTTVTTHTQSYSCCGAVTVAEAAHRWADGVCTVCGYGCEHDYAWQQGSGQYWRACSLCGVETAKQDIPTITITGADRVCATQDYTFTFVLPAGVTDPGAGYEFEMLGSDVPVTVDNGVCTGTVEAEWYDQAAASFDVIASGKTADGFFFTARKTVALLSNHTGGTATCVQQAACDVCGAAYGDVDPARHAVLQRVAAQPATQEHEGNVEYWFCADCGKYFADADGKEEIDESDLVTEKLPPEAPETPKPDPDPKPAADAKAPQTDDAFHPALLLAAMALCAAAAVGTFLVPKRRKHDR